ncbi:hypothetical protein V7112_08545 [Bacillus sp. JJ1566]|uniref:hypothetical protein n=1 Tax=Bacillus sp. JJ1566 TaxID=3122961 RepID=UPI002FFF8F01
MSLFGYPAKLIHQVAVLDVWGRVSKYDSITKNAKVVEEVKVIKNDQGEEVESIAQIHLEGPQAVKPQDYFLYTNEQGEEIKYDVKAIKPKKVTGTDDIKKVVVYG